MANTYSGHVLYLVHPDFFFRDFSKDAVLMDPAFTNFKRQVEGFKNVLRRALRNAKHNGIPIVWEKYAVEPSQDELKAAFKEGEFAFRNFLNENAQGARVEVLEGIGSAFFFTHRFPENAFKEMLSGKNLEPSKFTMLGGYREHCLHDTLQLIKNAFPKAKLYVAKGSGALSYSSLSPMPKIAPAKAVRKKNIASKKHLK
ncbi:MAG: hypothetical protein NUV57_01740 [archaeon]|nr:hypothetical protein [archaeon]